MKNYLSDLAKSAAEKTIKAIDLVDASLNKIQPFDPEKIYTPDELESYDALCDRFVRGVESAIKFFKTYERAQFAEISETIRDLFNRMEKLDLISSHELWLLMRDIRNRIVHDYLPEQIKDMYDLISGPYSQELLELRTKLIKIQKQF